MSKPAPNTRFALQKLPAGYLRYLLGAGFHIWALKVFDWLKNSNPNPNPLRLLKNAWLSANQRSAPSRYQNLHQIRDLPLPAPPQPPQERTGKDGGLQKKREENEQRFVWNYENEIDYAMLMLAARWKRCGFEWKAGLVKKGSASLQQADSSTTDRSPASVILSFFGRKVNLYPPTVA